jgi:uncharacterized Zn-binding protein involved in type VI secretion
VPPAARMTDITTHGAPLAPGPGSNDVLIGFLPAWRAMIDQHACPIVSISGPDGIGSVIMGSPTVFIDFMMACRQLDIVVEKPGLAMGPMNPIMMGEPTVIIGEVGMGTPAMVGPVPPLVLMAQAMGGSGNAAAQSASCAAQSLAQAAQSGTAVIQPCPGCEALAQAAGAAGNLPVSPTKTAWVEITLEDQNGQPVAGEPYKIKLPDGSTVKGTLDDKGFARVDGIDPGTCQITFPKIDTHYWKPK